MTTWHTPVTWTYGQLITTDDLNEQVRDNIEFLHQPAFARVHNNAAISIPNAANTILTFNTDIRVSPASMHSIVSNTSRLIAPSTGYYYIHAQLEFGGASGGRRLIDILRNGAVISSVERSSVGTTNEAMQASTLYELTAGDYVEIRVYQNSGSAINVTGTATTPDFMMVYLGAFA